MSKQLFSVTMVAVFALLGVVPSMGQPRPGKRYGIAAPELSDAPDEWLQQSLDWASSTLAMYPPARRDHPGRLIALVRLDDILFMESASTKLPVQRFYHSRMEAALQEIEQTRVTEGMRIWKLYNQGFFVRTPTVSFVFDLHSGTSKRPGAEGFPLAARWLERIADQADIAFISHGHSDHASPEVVQIFMERKKPVIAPERLWEDQPQMSKAFTYLKRSADIVHEVPVQNGKQKLQVVAYPGYQTDYPNNVHLVTTPEGLSLIHFGDRSGRPADFEWMNHIGFKYHVDVMLSRTWPDQLPSAGAIPPNKLLREARAVNPQLVISGHEHELGHGTLGRVGYTETYQHLYGSPFPFLAMTWGESYHYHPNPFLQRPPWPKKGY